MNKLQFSGAMLLAAASVWTSCQSEDEPTPNVPVQGNAISFRIQGSQPSTYVLPTTVDKIDGFVVNGWVDDAGSLSKVLFNQKSVVRDATSQGNSFIYSPIVFFPGAASEADFVAYSPISANVGTSSGKFKVSDGIVAGDNVISYTTPNPAANGGTIQEDLLVATTKFATGSGANVGFAFRHALSRVLVSIKNSTQEPLIITSLKLVNINTEGYLDLDADSWTAGVASTPDINDVYAGTISDTSHYKKLWSTESLGDMEWLLPPSGVAVMADGVSHAVVSAEQAMLVLPQTTILSDTISPSAGSDFHLLIGYQLSNITAYSHVYFKDIQETTLTSSINQVGLTFEFGKQYNLNLEFTPSGGSGGGPDDNLVGISFDVEVKPWENVSDAGGTAR